MGGDRLRLELARGLKQARYLAGFSVKEAIGALTRAGLSMSEAKLLRWEAGPEKTRSSEPRATDLYIIAQVYGREIQEIFELGRKPAIHRAPLAKKRRRPPA